MFNNLRSSGHNIFTRLLMLMLVASFVLWGIGDIFKSGIGDNSVAHVGKAAISQQEFISALRMRQAELREKIGKAYSPELAKKLGLDKQALDGLINRFTLEQETAAAGIAAGEDDVIDYIAHNPEFHDNKGRFSKEVYLSVLESNNRSEKSYVAGVQKQLGTKLMLNIIGADIGVPDALVEAVYRARGERRVAGLLVVPFNAAAVSVPEPTLKDVQAYYDANKDKYLVPEYRSFSYIEMKNDGIASSVNVTDAEIQKAYEDRAEEFKVAERRTIDQMVFEKKEDAEKAHAALESGKTFAEIAASSKLTNKDKLTLGLLTKDQVPVAADEVFLLSEGKSSKPAESPFGWHVLYVQKILPAGARPITEVRDQLVKDITDKMTQEVMVMFSNNMVDALGGGASFEDAAKKVGQKLHTVPAVTRDGLPEKGAKPEIPAYANFMETVFTTPENDHSRMMQAENGSYYMVRVDKVYPEHARPLSEVSALVQQAVKKELAEKKLREIAEQIATDLKAGKKPEEVLAPKGIPPVFESTGMIAQSTEVIGDGKLKGKVLPPELVDELFRTKLKSYTKPYALEEGGYAIGVVEQIVPAAEPGKSIADSAELKTIREELAKSLSQEVQYNYLQYLRTKYPVTINQSILGSLTQGSGQGGE